MSIGDLHGAKRGRKKETRGIGHKEFGGEKREWG